jgi:hypothetical protein
MPLIWTDDNGRVTRVHNQPSRVPAEYKQDAIDISSTPDVYDPETGQQLHYTEQDGFYYE